MSVRREDISGKKFGKLIPLYVERVDNQGHAYWMCRCECGNLKVVRGSHLKTGNVKTCGCVSPHTTHGYSHTRLYRIWNNMIQRCENTNNSEYAGYGGRGISVCAEWHDFVSFMRWAVKNGYSSHLSIDRRNNDDGYNPSNCRWATALQQANNTRKTRIIEYNGKSLSLSEWARRLGMNESTLSMRLNKCKWSVEKALNTEVGKNVS